MGKEIAERLPIQRELFDPQKLLRSIAYEVKPTLNSRGLSLKVMMEEELQTDVISDSNILHQIIIELLNYFIEKMPSGEIDILMDTQVYKPNSLLLMIEGNNWSVPEENLLSLFSGTDATLTKAERLTQQLGGTISAENEIGKGTTFVVIIPVGYLPSAEFLSTLSNLHH